jgi:N6-L-threonylcarbamoyladenine synthase
LSDSHPLILGIESSCDETGAAVVKGLEVLSSIVATQDALHAPFRGVVPEIASRAHAERISQVISRALQRAGVEPQQVDAIAVANRPGLIGSLLVGLSAAKALALAWNKPLVDVDHIEAHIHSVLMSGQARTPLAVLVASGGHTSLYALEEPGQPRRLGATLDDAAGEAFDKVAALLGLGFPGGPAVERAAREGNRDAFDLPRPMMNRPELNCSFSGLKTAVLYILREHGYADAGRVDARVPSSEFIKPPAVFAADVAASFQEAAVDVLVGKLLKAARQEGLRGVGIAGGVALNGRLRERLAEKARQKGLEFHVPDRSLCADNGAMVGALGALRYTQGHRASLDLDARARTAGGRAPRKGPSQRRVESSS